MSDLAPEVAAPLLALVQNTIERWERGEISDEDVESVSLGVKLAIRSRTQQEEPDGDG